MNRLKQWFGISDIPANTSGTRTQVHTGTASHDATSPTANKNDTLPFNNPGTQSTMPHAVVMQQNLNVNNRSDGDNANGSINIAELNADFIELWIREQVRIKPEDCLGCKMVATLTVSFLLGTSMKIIQQYKNKLPPQFRRASLVGHAGLSGCYVWWLRNEWFYHQ